jgi:hypothetical protein
VRTSAVVASLLFALVATACQGKPKPADPPATGSGSAAAAKPGAGSAGSAASAGAPAAKLASPRKTTVALEEGTSKKLSRLVFPDFTPKVHEATAKQLEVEHLSETRPKIAATVTLQPCFDCLPMDVVKWRERTEALKTFLAPELRGRVDTVFEVGAVTVAETPMIYTYQAGLFYNKEGGAYSHAYILYYNDGVNMARVIAEYKDDPPADLDKMIGMHPRGDLEALANQMMTAYTHEW